MRNPAMRNKAQARRKLLRNWKDVPAHKPPRNSRPRGVRIDAAGNWQRETENPAKKSQSAGVSSRRLLSDLVKGRVMLNGGVCAANGKPYTAKQRPFWTPVMAFE